jgi:hypothetical protein
MAREAMAEAQAAGIKVADQEEAILRAVWAGTRVEAKDKGIGAAKTAGDAEGVAMGRIPLPLTMCTPR